MFVVYTTLNGHLEKYLKIVFGSSSAPNGVSVLGVPLAGAPGAGGKPPEKTSDGGYSIFKTILRKAVFGLYN